MSNEKAIDRIRKLLNMTVENGCTEDEQQTAMGMAAAIAAREGIADFMSLGGKTADQPKRKAVNKYKPQALKPHQALAAAAAAELFGIECNVYNLGARGIQFVGREELIEMAEHTMFWLFRQIEELYKRSLPKGMTQRDRNEFRKTFKAACAQRTLERARQLMREMKHSDTAAQAATGQNALVVTGHFEQLKDEVDTYWTDYFAAARQRSEERKARMTPEQIKLEEERQAEYEKDAAKRRKAEERRRAKGVGPREGRSIPTGSGTRAGRAAGDEVKLRKEVE